MLDFFNLQNLENVHKNNPGSIVFAHLASFVLDQEDPNRAIDICNEGLEKHPNYAFGHFILGLAYYHNKNYTDAKRELELSLTLDSANPRAWDILTSVNEILNLSDDAKKSSLNAYLLDFLNENATNIFLEGDGTKLPTEDEKEHEEVVTELENDQDSKMVEKEIDELIESTISEEETEDNFESALNEVFENVEADAQSKLDEDQQEDILTYDSEPSEEKESEILDNEGMVSADEFTSAIDSFFDEYEEMGDTDKPTVDAQLEKTTSDLPKESQDKVDDLSIPTSSEDEVSDEIIQSGPIFEVEDIPQQEETVSLNKLDLDLSDYEEEGEPKIVEEKSGESEISINESTDSSEEDIQENIASSELPNESPERITEGEEIELPDIALDVESEEIKISEDKVDSEISEPKKPGTTKFEKPPILSPTLGEIYIAQGRFEEAIDVFRQLLEKDPESTRFKRKIEDLEIILKKKKSD